MRELVVTAAPRRSPNWGFSGSNGAGTVAHTVARACVMARKEADALVIVDDQSAPVEDVVRLLRQRAAKDGGVPLTVGIWINPGAEKGRAYVTAAKVGAAR